MDKPVKTGKTAYKPSKGETALSICVAVAATGLLLLSLFVSKEQLRGNFGYHLLQIFFTVLAAASAVGMVMVAVSGKRGAKKK